jgi:hypothetical protein
VLVQAPLQLWTSPLDGAPKRWRLISFSIDPR